MSFGTESNKLKFGNVYIKFVQVETFAETRNRVRKRRCSRRRRRTWDESAAAAACIQRSTALLDSEPISGQSTAAAHGH